MSQITESIPRGTQTEKIPSNDTIKLAQKMEMLTVSTGDDALFDAETWITTSVQQPLPSGYTLRPLCRSDHAKSYLDCLKELTQVGAISQPVFQGV
jgi:hypothetical protein